MAISRRDVFGILTAVSAQLLCAQGPLVVVNLTVTDAKGIYVGGLKASDFRVFEDEIPQKIETFIEGGEAQTSSANSYTIAYRPDPSNQNQGFRKFRFEI